MRNKAEFLKDSYPCVRPEFREALNVVEDAPHLMAHTGECVYVIPSKFTVSGEDECFLFEKKNRPATDDSTQEVPDYFYVGRDK